MKIYLPPVLVPPKPGPVPWYEKLKKLKYEIEHVMMPFDPLKSRFLCMLEAMERRQDDRVIFWDDIAPGSATVAPLGVTRNPSRSLADEQWLFDNFKTWQDEAAMYPYGNGTDPRRFVLSLHKVLFEPGDGSLSGLQWANAKIVETHVMLDRWANVCLGWQFEHAEAIPCDQGIRPVGRSQRWLCGEVYRDHRLEALRRESTRPSPPNGRNRYVQPFYNRAEMSKTIGIICFRN